MSISRRKLGSWGESVAADYLTAGGYTILERNARTRYGEIDLVARQEVKVQGEQKQTLKITVFVEVKTRSSKTFGYPEESITARKRAHMLAAAQAYLQEHPDLDDDWRIDVIAIQRFSAREEPGVVHFENALQE